MPLVPCDSRTGATLPRDEWSDADRASWVRQVVQEAKICAEVGRATDVKALADAEAMAAGDRELVQFVKDARLYVAQLATPRVSNKEGA